MSPHLHSVGPLTGDLPAWTRATAAGSPGVVAPFDAPRGVVLGLLAVAAVVTALRRRARAFRGTRYSGVAAAVSSDT